MSYIDERPLSRILTATVCLGIAGTLFFAASAQVLSQSQQGAALVQELCAMCHAVGPSGNSPHPAAPPFRRLGNSHDLDKLRETLERGTILPGHPDMPIFKLDRGTAREVINYIRSIQD